MSKINTGEALIKCFSNINLLLELQKCLLQIKSQLDANEYDNILPQLRLTWFSTIATVARNYRNTRNSRNLRPFVLLVANNRSVHLHAYRFTDRRVRLNAHRFADQGVLLDTDRGIIHASTEESVWTPIDSPIEESVWIQTDI
jgi:hypothetical protein